MGSTFLGAAACCLVLGACSALVPTAAGPEAAPGEPSARTQPPVEGEPPVEPEPSVTTDEPSRGPDVEPDQPVNRGPAASLPTLPVGGSAVPLGGGRQCASVSWIVDRDGPAALQNGVTIAITGVVAVPDRYTIGTQSCDEERPSCVGYTFSARSAEPACVVSVWPLRPGEPGEEPGRLQLAGDVHCDGATPATCRAFVAAATQTGGSVGLLDDAEAGAPEPSEASQPSEPASEPAGG